MNGWRGSRPATAGWLLLTASLAGAAAAAEAGSGSGSAQFICIGKYALCAEATCEEVLLKPPWSTAPKEPTANCECVVYEEGPALGDTNLMNGSCDPPTKNIPEGFHGVWSLFSLREHPLETGMVCPKGRYAQCWPMACIYSDENPRTAICNCPIQRKGRSFVTEGGGCEPANCSQLLLVGGGLPFELPVTCPRSKTGYPEGDGRP